MSGRTEELADVIETVIGHAVEGVIIRLLDRMHLGATDHADGNWLITPIEIKAGAFTATLGAGLRAEELRRFRQDLEHMNMTLHGEALLESLDAWIELIVTCKENGALVVEGWANDRPAIGNRLEFSIRGLGQTYLPPLIDALRPAEEAYPVFDGP